MEPSYNLKDVEKCFRPYNYYVLSDEEEVSNIHVNKNKGTSRLDDFFIQEPDRKKKKARLSSTVGRAGKEGNIQYISTDKDDGMDADILVKIDLYSLKKLKEIPVSQHWKNADIRVKYYMKNDSNIDLQIKDVVYNITKEISEEDNVKHYSFKN
ncbi:uncharacterized protein LOC123689114 [Pieris rapae]|uniref:uncharacterized protein LOC123689125 n=1 Tax=Pieris rapae TaxID=64459 RepID=UPI001E28107D|nr:uncharacterized protein LOC123689125 [Pieris rapae]XP_045483976.1 uncharacterized protein LOC123689114 [Pieris rapae]